MTDVLTEEGLVKNSPSTIYTFGGGSINPLDPDPDDISIETIAHALSQQCRWTGHTIEFYSVAEHCVHVSNMLHGETVEVRLAGLLHDASEAYLSDLARPVKHAPGLGVEYLKIEARLEEVIRDRFGISHGLEHEKIKAADEAVLWKEAKELVPHLSAVGIQPPEDAPRLWCYPPKVAEYHFLAHYNYLNTNRP